MKRDEFLHLFGFGATLLLTGCLGSCGSKTDTQPAPGPGTPGQGGVDFTLDTAAPANARLHDPAFGYVYDATGRVIVAKTTANSYVARAAACTHQGTAVQYEPGAGSFLCPNHGSRFGPTGAVLNGPANTALRSYQAVLTGTLLRVTA